MQLYGVTVSALCVGLLLLILVLKDEISDYKRFVQELKWELDDKTRECESLKAQLKKGDADGLVFTSLEKKIITQRLPPGRH